jgi:tetratricopeptide (TPR) repeat protein
MRKEITVILDALEKDDPSVIAMEKNIREMLNDQRDLYSTRYNVKEEVDVANRIHTHRQPYYFLYLAIAHLKIGDKKPAKEALAHAVQGFSIAGSTLNEALAEWFFGIIHFEDEKLIRAEQACKRALSLLDSLIQDYELKGAYNHAQGLRKHYKKIEKFTRGINSRSKKKKADPPPTFPPFQIRIPWVEVYDSVQAGINGIIWSDAPGNSRVNINEIEIEGKAYILHPVTVDEADEDAQLTLSKKLKYGLAKVRGQSMNASKPVPIEEGDYVLFSSKKPGNRNAIVIAGYALTDHETTTMVKKFMVQDKLLVSETTDTSEEYPPIEMTDEHKILGTVIAVAKPVK